MVTNTIDLCGLWSVTSTDAVYKTEVQVPGSLIESLEKDGHFGAEGIFYRENNRAAVAVMHRGFVFSRSIFIDSSFFLASDEARFYLEADGLDTLATLYINGKRIADTQNMHRRYRFLLDGVLQSGENSIEIHFADALQYVSEAQKKRELWHSFWGMNDYAFQGFNRIRKSHCSFGWDWGPIVPDVGIWRALRIVRYDSVQLHTPLIRQLHEDNLVKLEIEISASCWTKNTITAEACIEYKGNQNADTVPVESQGLCSSVVNLADANTIKPEIKGTKLELTVPKPELWWPNGLGEQNVYTLTVYLKDKSGSLLASHSLDIGLRTLTVKREKDEWGESFTCMVNGVPFFARGADWIPEDVCLTRPTAADTERLLHDAALSNFNCLRVWGGGVYPSNEFFGLCDRYGLIVWQDLMFACAIYDVNNPVFMNEISEEIADNLERIRHHASLALICGNNEMEWGFEEWDFPHTPENRTEYLKQYQFIIPELVKKHAPDTFYWPASPSSGGDFDMPNDPDRGDTHYWEVWHGNKDFKEYEKHYFRFMSEFGFESFPDYRTIESFTGKDDLNAFSPVMEDHQRCKDGNQKILTYISKYFRMPASLRELVYLSQLSQAEAIRHGVEHWRRNRGRCMGAVYWQYNDNWPVISWSSIDYYGRWKALQYEAKRCFANILLSCKCEGSTVELHLSNESLQAVSGQLQWTLYSTDGRQLCSDSFFTEVGSLSSICTKQLDFSEETKGISARNCILFYQFTSDSGFISDSAVSFVPFKALSLKKTDIQISGFMLKDGKLGFHVSSEYPALFVELYSESDDMIFSDNFFHLDGKSTKEIWIERGTQEPEALSRKLLSRSLNMYY